MSLEVAGHHGGAPIPSHLEDEGLIYLNDHRTHLDHEKHSYRTEPHSQLSKSKQRFFGKNIAVTSRFMIFWSIILCLLAVLAVVAAGVAGSIAAKRGRNLSSCMSMMHTLEETTTNGNGSSVASVSSATNSSNAQDSNSESFISTSDCSTLTSPYSPTLTSTGLTVSNNSFNIKCDTDYSDPDADFLTVAVFTFEDCIAACASYNQRLTTLHPNLTCYIASFGLNLREVSGGASPSCRLKASKNIAPAARPGVSYSALLITG